MSSRSLDGTLRSVCAAALLFATGAAADGELRVCADPDNLPYSHADGSGFENRIAAIVARDVGLRLAYAWQPLQRGFVRKTLGAALCDVLMGVPTDFERTLTTRPYYRSSFVFVQRAHERPPVRSFADPRLRSLRIGVQLVGNDMAATPPGNALTRYGLIDNVSGYLPLGDGPSARRILTDIARGALDLGVVWGPQAGYFARISPRALVLVPIPASSDPELRFEFSISIGVARGNQALRDRLDASLDRRRDEIAGVLAAFAVPRTDASATGNR
jgi:mxaJ protein